MNTPGQVGKAFSSTFFADAYDHLAADIRWVLVGAETIVGREQVVRGFEPGRGRHRG